MSETTTPPPGGGEPAPAPEPTSTPAPDSGQPTPSPEPETPEQAAETKSRTDRRIAEMTARMSAMQRERDRLAAEADFYRRNLPAPQQNTPEARQLQERDVIRQEVEAKIRTESFHEQGSAQYPDWRQKCDDLVKMGADPHFAQLLVEMPGGPKIAAALAEDPAAVERIASIATERGRAVALGKYAATVEDAPGRAPAAAPLTRAPAPVRTVTGRASPAFNEHNATAQQLVDFYMKQDLERRMKH